MASVSAEILKSGYLTTVKNRKTSLFSKQQKAYWTLKSQPTGLECYSNERDADPKEKIQLVNTRVYEHTSDSTILCIETLPGSQVRFLRADSSEQRDGWCEAILMVIRKLSGQDVEPRSRVYTDTSADRRRPKAGRTATSAVQSSAPTMEKSFAEKLVEVQQRPLPQIPGAETEDDGISKIQQTPNCCKRHHIEDVNKEGTDVVYENIHYVRSKEEWVKEVEQRQKTLVTQSDIYDGFHDCGQLNNTHRVQRPTSSLSDEENQDGEPVYEQSLRRRREPEENDERTSGHHSSADHSAEDEDPYLTPGGELFPINNLSKVLPQQPAHQPSLDHVNLPLRPDPDSDSVASTEDNTETQELPQRQKPRPELPQRQKPRPESPQRPKPHPELPKRQKPRPELPQRQKPRPELPQRQKPRPELPQRQKPRPELPQRQKPRPVPSPRQKQRPEPQERQEPMSKEELLQKLETLIDEQKQRHGITKTIRKSSLIGNKIDLMEMNDGIWVTGWDPSDTSLGRVLKVGDQLIKINKQNLRSADFAQEIIRSTDDDEVTVVLKRLPYASVCPINRSTPRDNLGIKLAGNEIIEVLEWGLVSKYGNLKPQTTGVSGHMCNWAITEVNMSQLDLFANEDSVFKTLRSGNLNDLVLVVQPVDFIQKIREKLQEKV